MAKSATYAISRLLWSQLVTCAIEPIGTNTNEMLIGILHNRFLDTDVRALVIG